MPNINNINILIDWLKADQGRHYRMQNWACPAELPPGDVVPSEVTYEFCKTAFCLAGHIWWLTETERQVDKSKPLVIHNGEFTQFITRGQEWLDIPGVNARALFLMGSQDHREAFDNLTHQARSEIAIKVLEKLRDEGVVDWEAFFPDPADDVDDDDYDYDNYDDDRRD